MDASAARGPGMEGSIYPGRATGARYRDPAVAAPASPLLRPLDLRGVTDYQGRLPRPDPQGKEPVDAVRDIIDRVRSGGDRALRELTARFDGAVLDDLRVPDGELTKALGSIDPAVRDALEQAAAGIDDFHRAQLHLPRDYRRDGIEIREVLQPVDRAGCYVPGGRARYPSTVLMTVLPAKAAGVDEVVVCVPPDRDGSVPDVVLAAAALAGADAVYRVGGAQAIAAMAYGTESIPAVDVIVGPGNVYVAVAKREVAGRVAVPSAFTGPSEVVVVADDTAPAEYAAIDLVVQAEHGPDGLAWLITWSEAAAAAISDEVARCAARAPRREEIEATLGDNGYAVLVDGPVQAIEVANLIAPEHLQLMTDDPSILVPLVRHAGAVFCGPWAPASVGDYVAGPSHVLPTFGSARFAGALTVTDFQKPVHVVTLDREALEKVGPQVVTLAEAEGLAAHAESIRARASGRDT